MLLHETHGESRHLANNFDVVWIANVADLFARLLRRNEDQVIAIEFAPAADICVTQLEEINWPIVFALPAPGLL